MISVVVSFVSTLRFRAQHWPPTEGDMPTCASRQDGYFDKDRAQKGDPGKREFAYFVLGAGRFIYASAARLLLLKVQAVGVGTRDTYAQQKHSCRLR